MTAQIPEVLIVEPGSIDLPQMSLYGVFISDLDAPELGARYTFANRGSKDKMMRCSLLWRGCVSKYRLKIDGTLVLERLEYPFTEGVLPDEVNEPLQGDFWLDLRESFSGDRVRIPFVDGKIVADKTHWKFRTGWKFRSGPEARRRC